MNDSRDRLIFEKMTEIRNALGQLRKSYQKGEEMALLHWVLPNMLSCGPRPLRHHALYGGSGKNIAPEAAELVKEWVVAIKCLGVRSVISLMHNRDLGYYAELDLGAKNLIEFYEKQGLYVEHLPWEDPHHSKTQREIVRNTYSLIRERALVAYDELPKPVLIQCSAGVDRTAPVAAYIYVCRRTPMA